MEEHDLFALHSHLYDKNEILIFKGVLTQDILVRLTKILEKKLIAHDKCVIKRMFLIFVELAQNIYRYSSERLEMDGKDQGCGLLIIREYPEHYNIISGNLVKKEQVLGLMEHCYTLNKLDEEGLKNLRKKMLANNSLAESKGAGVGLIDIIRKSSHPIKLLSKEVDAENSYMFFSLKISKFCAVS